MIFETSKHHKFWQLIFALCLLAVLSPLPVLAQEDEPIAYIGHGAFFDSQGNQIVPTAEFVARAQEWYGATLLSGLSAAKKSEFASFESRLNEGIKIEGQARLIVQQRLLDWLVANSPRAKNDGRMIGKLNALKSELNWKLRERSDLEPLQTREKFRLDPDLEKKLKQSQFDSGGGQVFLATLNSGQAYLNECMAADVPIPPPIGQLDPQGVAGWKTEGFIPTNELFIEFTPAEVRSYQSASPLGLCIALPRYTNVAKTTVYLDGVICLSQTTSKVCFWDNQMNQVAFSFASGTKIPIGVPDLSINPAGQYQAGGFELLNGSGGVCTDCHAGQNPYIIHPNADLGGGLLMGSLNLPTFSPSRYDPLVAATWPQNALSHSAALVPPVCKSCHQAGGSGGAFPHLSSEIGAYCRTVLATAINGNAGNGIMPTMPPPPFTPGSEANNPDVIAFQDWCNSAATSGPSNRGDPHLTTTNSTNYDFQAAGEFIALRNSATRFELQTRQSPVSTTFTPGANAHTGLSSCVSLNTAAALRVGKHRITYQPGHGGNVNAWLLQLRVDGALVALPANGINLGNGNTIAKTASGDGIDVTAADGTRVIITPNFWSSQGYWYLNIEVLDTPAREGTMGSIPAGDWLPLAPDGSSFGPAPASLADRHVLLNKKFADAWRVTKTTTMFDYALGTSTANFTDRDWPPESGKPCEPAIASGQPAKSMDPRIAKRLCSVIEDKAVFENCVLDLTAMGDKDIVKAYLLTLQLRATAQP